MTLTFKPKATRPSQAELSAALAPAARSLPPAHVEDAPPPTTVQVNFRCSEHMAEVIARRSQEAGSTRRMLARLLADSGESMLEADLHPVEPRRRYAR